MVQIFIGASGLVGVFVRYVGPLTVAPLTLLLSLSVVKLCVRECAKSWTSLLFVFNTFNYNAIYSLMVVLIGTALFMEPIKIPVPVYSKKEKRVKVSRKPIFAMFPVRFNINLLVDVIVSNFHRVRVASIGIVDRARRPPAW